MQDIQMYFDQVLESDENYKIFTPILVNDLKENQK